MTARSMVSLGTVEHLARTGGADLDAITAEIAADALAPSAAREVALAATNLVPLNSSGDAELLARAFAGHWIYSHANARWYYGGTDFFWVLDKMSRVVEAAKLALPSALAEQAEIARRAGKDDLWVQYLKRVGGAGDRKRLRDAIELAQSDERLAIESPSVFDADPYLLGVQNGVIDLRTGELLAVTPEMRLMRRAGTHFDPSARCPRFLSFLAETFATPDDRSICTRHIEYERITGGVMLTGDRSCERVRFDEGRGSNGKSVLRNLRRRILGDFAVTLPAAFFERPRHGRDGGSATPDVSMLVGKRLALVNETAEGSAWDEQRLKALASTERVTTRELYGAPYSFEQTAFMTIAGNSRPTVRGADEGIWRRLDVVSFPHVVPPERRDPGLEDALWSEAPGILAWWVSGAVDWYRSGRRWPTSPIVEASRQAYRTEQDVIGRWLADCTERGGAPSKGVVCHDAMVQLHAWSAAEGLQARHSLRTLTQRLAKEGIEVGDTTRDGCRVKFFRGLVMTQTLGASVWR